MATPVPALNDTFAGNCRLHTWALTTADHTGEAIELAGAADRTLTATGTWGGATAQLMGSMDGVTYIPMNDAQGDPIALTVDSIVTVLDNARYIKAQLTTEGSGATVSVALLSRSTR